MKRSLELKQQNKVMQVNEAKADSVQLRAEQGRVITSTRGDNEKAQRKTQIQTEMDLQTPNIK